MRKDSTQSNAQWHEDFNVEAWRRGWYLERLQHPAWLLIQAKEPLRSRSVVSIVAIAEHPYPEAARTTQWSLCLIGERLTAYTAEWLATTLRSISTLQGVDTQEALAFLMHPYLYATDLVRAGRGEKSLLFEKQWTPFGHSAEDLWPHLSTLITNPVWELERLLRFWALRGQLLSPGALLTPEAPEGRLSPLTIPELWMPFEDLQKFSDKKAEPLRIPVLVDPVVQPLTERFAPFAQACLQTGVPLQLSKGYPVGTNQGQNTSRDEEGIAGFRHSADFRSVTWRGHEFSLTPDQAIIVKELYKAYENGTPEVGQRHLLEQADRTGSRVRDLFKSKGAKDIWKRMIMPGKTRGTYRLNL